MDCRLPSSSVHGVRRVGHDLANKPPLRLQAQQQLQNFHRRGLGAMVWPEGIGCGQGAVLLSKQFSLGCHVIDPCCPIR